MGKNNIILTLAFLYSYYPVQFVFFGNMKFLQSTGYVYSRGHMYKLLYQKYYMSPILESWPRVSCLKKNSDFTLKIWLPEVF